MRYLSRDREGECYAACSGSLDAYIQGVLDACAPPGGTGVGGLCPHCSARAVRIDLRQLRSGDEGMTALAHCSACDRRWRA